MEQEEKTTKIFTPHKGFQESFVRSNVDVVIGGGSMGCGKQCPNYQEILTPNGWVKHGDIKVGDLVCLPKGGVAEVDGVFPQGDKDVYEFTFSDGRKCEAGLEHLWKIRTKKQINKYRNKGIDENFFVWETWQIIEAMQNGKEIYIPTPKAQEFSEKEYVIHPYVLGALIGDGALTEASITKSDVLLISNTEKDVYEKVAKLVSADRIRISKGSHHKVLYTDKRHEIIAYLRKVGLNTYSYNRFIPNEYLWGSIEQRKQLLFGLMDTDGTVGAKNRYSYCTTSERLAKDIVYLCRSLGYIATINIDDRLEKYTSKKAYRICIQTDDIIFSSEKHINRYNKNLELSNRKYARTNDHIKIVSIVKTKNTPCTCISVADKDHLYITKDFVTTHNSFAALLMAAEPSLDPNFRMVCLRKTLAETKVGGGMVDDAMMIYKDVANMKISDNPRLTFNTGAIIDFTHVSDQSPEKLLERVKGWQYDCVYFDEGTGYEWSTFKIIFSRNRGKAKWTGKIRITTNPKKTHWLREFVDWWIGLDGYPIPSRDGVVRYFFLKGKTVKDIVWGSTKEEVYKKCQGTIDAILRKQNKYEEVFTYKDLIKSATYYGGTLSENSDLLKNNPSYIGSIAAMGEKERLANMQGNWNVDPEEEEDIPIPYKVAAKVFEVDPQRNGDKWVTADLADYGKDNFIALLWNGFHIEDALILSDTRPQQNAERLSLFAKENDVGESHIIFDATSGRYMCDYLPEAIPYMSGGKAIGIDAYRCAYLKDTCYYRLMKMLENEQISFSTALAQRVYPHKKNTLNITIETEFKEECEVVRFKILPNGKKKLFDKKLMNSMLGKGRSMDLLDPIAMRMLPVLDKVYGEEGYVNIEEHNEENDWNGRCRLGSIYDETTWC